MGLLSMFGASPETVQRVQQGLLNFGNAFPEIRRQRMEEQAMAEDRDWLKKQRQAQMEAAARAEEQRRQQEQQRAMQDDLLRRAVTPVQPSEANAVSGITGPRPEALSVVGQQRQIDPLEYLRAGFDPKTVEFIANAKNLGRPEVARVLERAGVNGMPESVQLDRFGNPVGSAMPKPVESKILDLGGTKQAYNPYAIKPGQTFQTTMTPEGRDASARGWAGQRLAQERFAFERLQPPKPTAAQERADADKAKAGKQAEQMVSAIDQARGLLAKNPTASGAGALIDWTGRKVGMTSESAKTAAQLETLSGWMVANVPRMEGPQSNFDVENYKVMAAKVGDRTTPVDERLAALDTLEALHRKYAEINGTPLPERKTPKLDTKSLMLEADRIIGIGN